ncbi:acyl-CoA dehydrogenase [Haloferax mediterranei ATCC 33500]|uniref:Acyl-CoA dehydrogenase n=1 Tax=Haloferax mediterranei (strain ATCC 33500 / DSM 1411 / JCM 8866 / NBRC 14739 / NCIMB 2177 / R-4) TaxID=523841 RepID=I3R4N8_HALMT|nr:acyl-CoA dehydrogenase family protein [Haloferax mediterranei]AFK19198.1 acyl-CoA dehydrogenase [Haloferax mediterranei ATCC 33500]AHZ21440.1 acyl-CoA dehydrogenase [Haloferax mediterranei ATCC 33500]EMA03898.1 acyl-CoA dehydrogenase [Haloferax mediterranei ATCC 33500]MDX5989298.1 acyl-CoA dehydrogenase family protein [Haloferax mediterranei ATCC 33500]QCQ75667.1 acyl-CoA dehydrogenase [Haloferax mediterranei ATCC 33500]
MDYNLSDEQRAIRDEVRRFAENEIAPVAGEYDEEEKYPYEIVQKAAEMGLTGAHFPVEYGGVGYSSFENALVTEELFAVDPGIGLCITSAGFGAEAIINFGTEDQKERFLPPIVDGESVMGTAISEPQAGSDVTSVRTTAEKDGDEWVINGNKMWITNGTVGDYFVVMCQTDPDADDRYSGFSQIIVEADRDGFSADKITGKMGIRASDTAELIFDDVRVPEENLVGTRGMGFLQLMQFFDETRTAVAAQAVGIAKGACEQALDYAKEREQFGRSISDFQAVQHKLAEMHTATEAARQLTYKSAWSVDNDEGQLTALASMAKEFASNVATDVADEAVQIHGGAGFVNDHDVERLYRDAKITQIYEGTSEIQKNVIARELLGKGI